MMRTLKMRLTDSDVYKFTKQLIFRLSLRFICSNSLGINFANFCTNELEFPFARTAKKIQYKI